MTQTPWSTIGYLVFKRTYARKLDLNDPDSQTEEFEDVIERCIRSSRNQLKVGFTQSEEEELRHFMRSLKGLPAGRFLWQLGTETVDRLGFGSLQNCCFKIVDSPVEPFTWTMDMLMLGSGVGYSIQNKYIKKLPQVNANFVAPIRRDTNDADFIVPDSREGWVKLLSKVLKSAFLSQEENPTFSYSMKLVRPKGSLIKGFGGVASGPEELHVGIQQISQVLENRAGKNIRPIDALDVMNIIGSIVVAGNVRRSAQIAIGDPWDKEFLQAKRWDLGNIPHWRSMSNNTVATDSIGDLSPEFWETYNNNGECYGLANIGLSQRVGRLGETEYADYSIKGYNPCAEQGLDSDETCSLAEIFLPLISSYAELLKVITYLYRINKHALNLHCHHKKTEKVVHRNQRMGIGITGYLEATEEQKSWLPNAYKYLRQYDKEYSEQHEFPISVRLTTVKPSGTLSLLPGVTPGIHPAFARHLLRRVRIASNHPLITLLKSKGYPIEPQRRFDKSIDHTTMVVSFPFKYSDGAVLASEMTAIDQLKTIQRLQKDWSDNSVSCTVYFRPEELPDIKKYLEENYNDGIKTLSFLQHTDHGFDQAPLEEITEEQYSKLIASVQPLENAKNFTELELDNSTECTSGMCPIR